MDTQSPSSRYQWSRLNNQQVGAFTEYFVKMELTMYGFQVFGTEVDDRGVDFITRYEEGPFQEIQVKSLRKPGYIFMRKEHFHPRDRLYLAFGYLKEGQEPDLYLIPSTVWLNPDNVFVSHDYEGKASAPEWGLNFSKKNLGLLRPYIFQSTVQGIVSTPPGT